jgi:hypothetical protein
MMPGPRTAPGDGPGLSRRDFLTKRLAGRIAGLLGSGVAAAPAAATTAEAAPSDPDGFFSPRDLTRMSRDEVKAALARIRAERGRR